jgi:hypothetical protein
MEPGEIGTWSRVPTGWQSGGPAHRAAIETPRRQAVLLVRD